VRFRARYQFAMEAFCVCPYCGESVDFWLDESGGRSQHYVEDCAVCCRPIELHVRVEEDGEPAVTVARLDD
jgi:hypothetical protein